MNLPTLKKLLLLTIFSMALAFNTFAHHGEFGAHVKNNIIFYGPAIVVLVALVFWLIRYFRKANADKKVY